MGQEEGKHSYNIAVGSRDRPGLADDKPTTEAEAFAVLGSGVSSGGGPRLNPGMTHLRSCPTARVLYLWEYLPGPGAQHYHLPIDSPLAEVQHWFNGKNAAAWPLDWKGPASRIPAHFSSPPGYPQAVSKGVQIKRALIIAPLVSTSGPLQQSQLPHPTNPEVLSVLPHLSPSYSHQLYSTPHTRPFFPLTQVYVVPFLPNLSTHSRPQQSGPHIQPDGF